MMTLSFVETNYMPEAFIDLKVEIIYLKIMYLS